MVGRGIWVIKLRETIMILDLHQQGLTVSAISRETGIDRKTVRKYIERGLEAPAYGPRRPRATVIDPYASYLRERVKAYPGLTGSRLFRELRERGYSGGYTAVTDFLRDVRPATSQGFEVRFETPPGEQAQVDFAQFHVVFTDEPMTPRVVWLFSMVLGHSRLIWARFVMHQNLPTVPRCHIAAFEAIGGAPREGTEGMCMVEFGDGIVMIGEWHPDGDDIRLKIPAYRTAKATHVEARQWRLVRGTEGQWRSQRVP
jgi:transposase